MRRVSMGASGVAPSLSALGSLPPSSHSSWFFAEEEVVDQFSLRLAFAPNRVVSGSRALSSNLTGNVAECSPPSGPR